MGKILLPPAFRPANSFCGMPAPDEYMPDVTGWAPERLWLSEAAWHRSGHSLMHTAVCTAMEAKLAAGGSPSRLEALLDTLLARKRYAPALRVTARILRGARKEATPVDRDLASCALVLAALRHDDLLAAIELAAEASGRALTVDGEQDERPLPPGFCAVGPLSEHMRQQGRDVLAYRLNWPDLDTIGPTLAKALDSDPVAALLGYGGPRPVAEGVAP